MTSKAAMASRSSDKSIDRYISEINRYKILTREQEAEVAFRYRESGSASDADLLVLSNLRFVVKIAHEYRGYGLRLLDLIQEGNIGLMMAVKKFEPEKGYRLISYGVWWIRAYIQNYVMRSWSLVKLGTTQAQRKLFFKLRSEREKADKVAGPGERATSDYIANRLSVKERDIVDMEQRLASRDFSLDVQVQDGARETHRDLLVASGQNQEAAAAANEEREILHETVDRAMETFNEKERYIVSNRLLVGEPKTLQEIGKNFGISRERARQIEGNVLRKIKLALMGTGLAPAAA